MTRTSPANRAIGRRVGALAARTLLMIGSRIAGE
jgi:hypothetical protein